MNEDKTQRRIERHLTLERIHSSLKAAVDTAMGKVREAANDLMPRFQEQVFLAAQPFVFACLQQIETLMKLIVIECGANAVRGHKLAPLVREITKHRPHFLEAMQDEFRFWVDSPQGLHPRATFLHRGTDFAGFVKAIDDEGCFEASRYFVIERYDTLLDRPLDPRLLVHMFHALLVFWDHEFLFTGESRGKEKRADAHYFRIFRVKTHRYNTGILVPAADGEGEDGKALCYEAFRLARKYVETGKAEDFLAIEPARKRMLEWERSSGVVR